MRQFFAILFLLSNLFIVAQKCDTINGQVENCIDKQGKRQGHWLIRDTIIAWSCDDCPSYRNHYRYVLRGNGNYLNNNKIGAWSYYPSEDDFRSPSVEKTITYLDNGTSNEVNHFENYILELNNDTTLIYGSVLRYEDTIVVSCKNKVCDFKLKTKTIVTVVYTTFDKFYFDLLRVQIGMYDRKIKELKMNR